MEPIETFEHCGMTCALYADMDPMAPAEWDTLGSMFPLSRDAEYTAFGKRLADAPSGAREMLERRGAGGLVRYLSLFHGVTALPFDILEHGPQVTVRECPADDSTCSGYIGADAESIAITGVAPADVLEGLRGELETWRDYFDGAVVGYTVSDAGAVVDSCWGFYPDAADGADGYSYVRQEARAAAEYEREQRDAAARQGIPTVPA